MKEINEEIKLTLDSMQKTDIDEGSHSELRYHLGSLLEIKRNELQQHLIGRSWFEQDAINAPDISTLVEALELIIKAAPGRGPLWYGSKPIAEARVALTAYRKGCDV